MNDSKSRKNEHKVKDSLVNNDALQISVENRELNSGHIESNLGSPIVTSQTNRSNKFLESISKRESIGGNKSTVLSKHSVSPSVTNRRKNRTPLVQPTGSPTLH